LNIKGKQFFTFSVHVGVSSKDTLFKGTHSLKNDNMLYKNICGVFWAKTPHIHFGDIKGLFYILWKWHYTSP